MGIIKKGSIHKGIHFIVWKIEEEEKDLLAFIDNTDCTFHHIKNDKVRIQSISARVALHFLLKDLNLDFKGIIKEENGKPSLNNYSYPISISHSKNLAGAIIDLNHKPVGIDLEMIHDKVLRLIPRFANTEELSYAQKEHSAKNATQIWTIKEAVYKAFGKLNIEFKSQIQTQFSNALPYAVNIKEVNTNFQQFELKVDEIEDNKMAIAYQA